MSKKWKELKPEINEHVHKLESELERLFPNEFSNQTIYVTVKFKDNIKDALVTIVHNKLSVPDTTMGISLDNQSNLKAKFENLLSTFKEKVSKST